MDTTSGIMECCQWCYLWCSTLLTYRIFAAGIHDRLVIKVCCGDERYCERFTQPEELFGISCCGMVPMNQFTHICCANVVRQRMENSLYHELCCGNRTLFDDQTCCNNVVHNKRNGICCGNQAYDKQDRNKLCCNGTLIHATTRNLICCGSDAYDGGKKEICCGDQVYNKAQYDSCCRGNDGNFRPFRSELEFCCNVPVKKGAGNACCYLRSRGSVIPTPYNTTAECCKFPYNELVPIEKCKTSD